MSNFILKEIKINVPRDPPGITKPLKGNYHQKKVVYFVFLSDSRLEYDEFQKKIQVNCLNRSKVVKLFVFQL